MFAFLLFLTGNAFAAAELLLPKYVALMAKYPAKAPILTHCVTPKFATNRQAYRYRTALTSQFQEKPPVVDFCGRFTTFHEPITGGGNLFIGDCETGKVRVLDVEFASFGAFVRPESCLLIEHPPEAADTDKSYQPTAYGPPRLYHWTGKTLRKVADPLWRGQRS